MKRSFANPVKTMGGNVTSQDQFAAERYIRYNSDPIAPHSAITGIAEIALRHQTDQTDATLSNIQYPSYKFIKPLRNV
jgi:hypothetical protein